MSGITIRGPGGGPEVLRPAGVFVFIGLTPNSGFLDAGRFRRDAWGFLLTGRDLTDGNGAAAGHGALQPGFLEPSVPGVFAAGDSRRGQSLVVWAIWEGRECARACDAYVMHGDPPEHIAPKVADLSDRRARSNPGGSPLAFGVAAFVVCRHSEAAARREVGRITDVRQSARGYANYQDWIGNTQLERRVSLEDYSVSNRGLRAGLVGTPGQIAERIVQFERAGVDLLLLQCSPQSEEMERFAEDVIPLVRGDAGGLAARAAAAPQRRPARTVRPARR